MAASANGDALQDVTNNIRELQVAEEDEARKVGLARWGERVPYKYEEGGKGTSAEWASGAARYEWRKEYGDVGPPIPELEKQLFESEFRSTAGAHLEELNTKPEVTVESRQKYRPIHEWDKMDLHPVMRENIKLCCYEKPTMIQSYAIPAVLQGKDLIGIAQTGSGKTGAFLIPVLSKLMGKAKKLAAARPIVTEDFDVRTEGVKAEPLVLIICPTRELATQIFDETRRMCYRSMLRPCVAYGGAPSGYQRDELRKGCDILIGTPGRIIDFMGQPKVLSLRRVRYTIVDEADEMLKNDWETEFNKLMSGGDVNEDSDHRYMMFSATFNVQCRQLAREFLSADYTRIRVGRAGSSHRIVKQQVIFVKDNLKKKALFDLLVSMVPIRTLVFVNSKRAADFVDDYLYNNGLPTTSIHADRTQREREDAIRAFKEADAPILIATGLSARGLDIVNVMHVINFDLPKVTHGGIDEYVHRIGRTARIGNGGLATSFFNDNDNDLAPDLVKIMMECEQPIPEFLGGFTPSNNQLEFYDNTDDEADAANAANASSNNTDPWGLSEGPAEISNDPDPWGIAA